MRVYSAVTGVALLVCLAVLIASTVEGRPEDPSVFAVIAALGILAIGMIPVSIIDRRHQLDGIVRRAELEDRDADE